MNYTRPPFAITTDPIRAALSDAKKRGVRLRYLTEISKDNTSFCKELILLVNEIRHLDGIKGNFMISESEYLAPVISFEKGKIASQIIYSNQKQIVDQHQYIFDTLWDKATSAEQRINDIEEGVVGQEHYQTRFLENSNEVSEEIKPAEQKIKEIEEGVVLGKTEVIQNPADIQQLFINMIRSASYEVLLVIPTINSFYREEHIGIMELLKQAAEREDNRVKVRILTPTKDAMEEKLQNMAAPSEQRDSKREGGEEEQIKSKKKSFDIRCIDEQSTNEDNGELLAESAKRTAAVTTVTIAVVDRKESLVIEKKDDSKQNFIEAVGIATYSNSKPTVLSYVSIFENLWRQSELYHQLKESNKQLEQANEQLNTQDKTQKEFINVAAHELRTPIQPILGLTQMIYSKFDEDASPYEKQKQKEMLEVVIRNAHRLQRLSEDILDVTRIESQNLNLKPERLNLDEIISNAINDAKRSQQLKDDIILLYQQNEYDNNIFVEADRVRLNQVISNLISNAIKFTIEGSIIVSAKKEERENKVVVSVKDTGIGIHPEVLPRLFRKFATRSYQGTGLGLYISKSIAEAHGGKMWAEDNPDGKGAVFYFTLPMILLNRKE
jgi:two-component system sensor histidine kinase VicK